MFAGSCGRSGASTAALVASSIQTSLRARSVATLASRSSSLFASTKVLSAGRPAAILRLTVPNHFAAPALGSRGLSFFKGKKQQEDSLEESHLLTQPSYSREDLDSIKKTHRDPKDWIDRAAYYCVQTLRTGFDLTTFYKVRISTGYMRERDWLRRVIFLETVAGVPGMVAGMCRHLHSLRFMRRDYGWIHSLLSEAENERMHLLIALTLRQPGPIFRGLVIGGQAVFLTWYTIMYLICPRFCHRFVGYLEEEAVHTYTTLLQEIDSGRLPMFANLSAPRMARVYYHLPENAMLRDVFERIRADEGAHRDTNHHFGDLKPHEPNTMVEHLRQPHFQHQNVFSGVQRDEDSEKHDKKYWEKLKEAQGPETPESVVKDNKA